MMKRMFLAVLTSLTFSLAISQVAVRPQVGINFPSLTDDIVQGEWKGNVGYQFGADVQIGGNLYIQPGLNFQSTSLTVRNVGDLEVSRINLPVLLGLQLFDGLGSTIGIRAFAGPNFAINVNEELDESFNDITKDNIKNSLVSGLVGGGVDLGSLFVDVAYKFGLSKFFEDINNDANKNIFIVNAGIRFGG